MNERIDFDSLVTPPEFESRCDMFVAEIQREIVPKYPDIGIHPVNLTKKNTTTTKHDSLNKDVMRKIIIESDGEEAWLEYVKFSTRRDRLYDKLSTVENTAAIEIWGWGGFEQLPQILDSIEDIKDIARKYRGNFVSEFEDSFNLDDLDLPSAYLHIDFSDEFSEGR